MSEVLTVFLLIKHNKMQHRSLVFSCQTDGLSIRARVRCENMSKNLSKLV